MIVKENDMKLMKWPAMLTELLFIKESYVIKVTMFLDITSYFLKLNQ